MGCLWNDDAVFNLAISLLAVNAQLSPAIPLAIDPNRLFQLDIPASIHLVDLTDIRLAWYIYFGEIELTYAFKEIRSQFTRHNGRFTMGSSYLEIAKLETCLPEPGSSRGIILLLNLEICFIVCADTIRQCIIARTKNCLCKRFDKGSKEKQVLLSSGIGCRVEYRVADDVFEVVLAGSDAILPVFS